MSNDDLRSRAEAWARHDPDPKTRDELLALLKTPDLATTDLAERFAGSLEFGTAGLRGILGAGPNRMNRAVVATATWGVAQHLLATVPGAAERGVVVGYDGRHMSREFAEDTAAILGACGVRAHLFTAVCPTPLTAFAVKRLGAAAGVMVTASHNPPEYNGYKVYWENSAQIIPPTDTGIAARILAAPEPDAIVRPSLEDLRSKKLVVDVAPGVSRQYLDAVRALAVHRDDGDRHLRIVYTPLHGVGDELTRKALAEAGFADVTSVAEQQKPDGDFPTVAFPNPEEKGAMDLSYALGRRLDADLILANDPDADRLSVAVADATSPTRFRQLTGNEVGVLLGHYLLTERTVARERIVLASIVSSPLLGHIARALGSRYEETLTGFKWIANRAMEVEKADGVEFVFGYEEALGYTVGDVVRDKDGVSAAVLAAEIAAVLRGNGGRTMLDELESIHRRYGLFVSSQLNVTRKGAAGVGEIRAIMDRLRAAKPATIGSFAVEAISDYEAGTRVLTGGATAALTLPKSNVLTFDLAGGTRVIARPSGTEPKLKIYFDVREVVRPGEPMADADGRARQAMAALSAEVQKLAGVS